MKRRSLKARRLVLAAVLSAAVAAIALAFVPAAIEGTSNRHDLSAFVVVTQRGPLPRCSDDGSDCTAANIVWWFIHIVNGNRLSNFPPTNGSTRANTPNPGGIVVTQFTVHGTLNGTPVDVTASSPPIFQAR
jgi:hypothetical protein